MSGVRVPALDEEGDCTGCGYAPKGDGECECTRQWVSISCAEADRIRHAEPRLSVWSTITDPEGFYGPGIVFTEWGTDEAPTLRDSRYPRPDYKTPDLKPCHHEKPLAAGPASTPATGPRDHSGGRPLPLPIQGSTEPQTSTSEEV